MIYLVSMVVNMVGAIFLVPCLFSILRPRFFAASLSEVSEPHDREVETSPVAVGETA